MLLVCDDQADPTWQLIDVGDIDQVKTWINQHFEKRKIPLKRANGALQAIQGEPLVITKDNVDDYSF